MSSFMDINKQALTQIQKLDQDSQVVLVLCGIPGSGKSTFSRMMMEEMPSDFQNKWVVLNQDILQTRSRVEAEAHNCLNAGHSIVIDRCNFDTIQRSHWINLAYQYNVDATICVVLPNALDVQLCSQRATLRGNDGIHDPDTNWRSVCHRMQNEFKPPKLTEGFSSIFNCKNMSDLETIRKAIVNIQRQPVTEESILSQLPPPPSRPL